MITHYNFSLKYFFEFIFSYKLINYLKITRINKVKLIYILRVIFKNSILAEFLN